VKPVRLARKALTDLHGIRAYVAAVDTTAADRLLSAFQEAFTFLAEFPEAGHIRPDLTSKAVRFWNVSGFLIIYANEADAVYVVRTVRGSRDIQALLR
jgi:plasmid stabilization system protein ParE